MEQELRKVIAQDVSLRERSERLRSVPGVGETLAAVLLSAIQHNPVIRAFYQRLVGRGKPRKVALTACMRKMLTILNAILREETVWNPQIA